MNNKLLIIWLSFLGGSGYACLLWASILYPTAPYVAGAILGGVVLIVFLVYSFIEAYND